MGKPEKDTGDAIVPPHKRRRIGDAPGESDEKQETETSHSTHNLVDRTNSFGSDAPERPAAASKSSQPRTTQTSSDPETRQAPQQSKAGHVFRAKGISLEMQKPQVLSILQQHFENTDIEVKTLAVDAEDDRYHVATVDLKDIANTIPPGKPIVVTPSTESGSRSQSWRLDRQFYGLTTLYCPPTDSHAVDIVAITGLGGHAYGSFKERGGHYMWLADELPSQLPTARVLTYGYESALRDSHNFQSLDDLGMSFSRAVCRLSGSDSVKRPMIFIAHSLGGLIWKQAVIELSMSKKPRDAETLRGIYGALFFGVPNDGLDVESFIPLVGDGPNRLFVESLGQRNSEILRLQRRRFLEAFNFEDTSEIHCFYETLLSRTARRDDTGRWSLSGDRRVLVTQTSATHCRPWEDTSSHTCSLPRDHSDLVKFSLHDPDYYNVSDVLRDHGSKLG
jgi:hypothetical protein